MSIRVIDYVKTCSQQEKVDMVQMLILDSCIGRGLHDITHLYFTSPSYSSRAIILLLNCVDCRKVFNEMISDNLIALSGDMSLISFLCNSPVAGGVATASSVYVHSTPLGKEFYTRTRQSHHSLYSDILRDRSE